MTTATAPPPALLFNIRIAPGVCERHFHWVNVVVIISSTVAPTRRIVTK
jgi:hypothetical protein